MRDEDRVLWEKNIGFPLYTSDLKALSKRAYNAFTNGYNHVMSTNILCPEGEPILSCTWLERRQFHEMNDSSRIQSGTNVQAMHNAEQVIISPGGGGGMLKRTVWDHRWPSIRSLLGFCL